MLAPFATRSPDAQDVSTAHSARSAIRSASSRHVAAWRTSASITRDETPSCGRLDGLTEFPRGPLLCEGGLLIAHRTTPSHGSPAELWELAPNDARPTSTTSARASAQLVDAARLVQLHPLRCFGRVVHASESEIVIAAPAWVPLKAMRGRLATTFIVTWLRDILCELATTPSVVLRGLSPWTLAVTVTGEPRILDVMLAQFPEQQFLAATAPSVALDAWEPVFPFMSPEQVRGLELDGRRDIWSLAVIAIELLTGTRMFRGAAAFDILDAVRSQEVVLPPLHPPAVVRVFEAMLSRELATRPTAAEVVTMIERDLQLWSPAQMFAEVQRIAPDEAKVAIEYGY